MKPFEHAALFLTSAMFVYIFSYSTSPLYSLLGGDSAIFQVIGKYWYEGYLPYVNVFDHKGPLIFFVNMLGHAIQPRTGVAVLQIISLYMSCLFVWRAMELYSSNTLHKIFFMAFTLIYYAAHYEEGNHVTEYTLPFLAAATFCFLRGLKTSQWSPIVGLIDGLGFGACLLIRLSDAAQICCQIFLTAIFLFRDGELKLLRQNILSFCAGVVMMLLPFVIYFAAHGALNEMLYGTILLNVKYAHHTATHLPIALRVIYSAIHYLPFFATTIVATLALKQNPKSRLLWSGLFTGTMMAIMLIKLRTSDQYAMIFLAVAPILFAVLCESRDALQKIWHAKFFSLRQLFLKALIIFTVIHGYIMVFFVKSILFVEESPTGIFFTSYSKRAELLNSDERENILELRSIIPDNEASSFVCWANFCTGSHWILRANMKPRERFFMNNGLLMSIDPKIREEFFGNLRRDYPLWILYGTALNRKPDEPPKTFSEDVEFEQLLAEKYSLKGEVYIFPQVMKLYRLKN